MKNLYLVSLFALLFTIVAKNGFSQTRWKGTTNTNWSNAANWTAGVPTSTTDAIIGDASFTGTYDPTVDLAGSACKSITIGGTKASTLTLSKNLVVNGMFTINSNGIVNHLASTVTVKGDWINNGSYATSQNNSKVIFGGVSQMIQGTSATTFRKLTINAGASVILMKDILATGTGSAVQIRGTLDPGQSPTYKITSTVNFKVFNKGKIKVNASTFAGNYVLSGVVTLNNLSEVEYSSTTVNQIISSAYSYAILTISGTGTKSLAANLPALNSANANQGKIFVNSGTLDLGNYTANRGTTSVGGSLNVLNGAFLKIGGTSNFPLNYNARVLSLGSTVEYNGDNQTVSSQTYGNLVFSSKSASAIKTLPGTDFTIEGNFSSVVGTGTSVTYTAASNITINGNTNIGISTTFNGASFSHISRGNWINNGTFSGSTGTVSFNGPTTVISGNGTHNFNNINIMASGITAAANTLLNVSGNLLTGGPGQFTHLTGGMVTMTGASKSISGGNINFNDLNISGSISTNASFTINNNLSGAGALSASDGTIIMEGAGKAISGTGTKSFSTLQVTGIITNTSKLFISTLLDVSGTFSASAETVTFTGSSALTGTANLYNVTINGTSLQLSANSVLGVAKDLTITSGVLDVAGSLPNTVNFNGTTAQNINAITFNNLILSNGNTKSAVGNITVNGNITIATATTFAGSSFTHTIFRNWINSGTFTPSTGTIQFTGPNNSTITGTSIFSNLGINKSSASTTVTLANNMTANNVSMLAGKILTGSNNLMITNTRTGNGIIVGSITRNHAFSTGIPYAFEGPDNTINFSAASGITSITVNVTIGNIADFPDNASINRQYTIAVTGTSYNATLRLHYEDQDLNGNNEALMGLWKYSGTWTSMGKSANSTTSNYIEQAGLTDLNTRWTCSELPGVARWNGSVVGGDWNTAANWTNVSGTASLPPSSDDIVQIGTAPFTNQPTINNDVNVKGITFGSAQAATLTLGTGGSLTTNGNIAGNWSSNVVHTINAGNQNLTVNGDLSLSNGVNGQSINLNVGSGNVKIMGTLNQKGNASILFSGSGVLNLGGDFLYSSGTFTSGSGSVKYAGNGEQEVAAVPYNHLIIDNTTGNASIANAPNFVIGGSLSILSGHLEIDNSTISVVGNTLLSPGTMLDCDGVTINAGGNWTNSGTYLSTSGTVIFNGAGTQNISAGTFNNFTINKSSGIVNLTGNNAIAGNVAITKGDLNLSTFTLNRQSSGGSITMGANTSLFVSGAFNFPSNFTSNFLNATSNVTYNGSMAQFIAGANYGNLLLSNGGSNAKTQFKDIGVAGDLVINTGSTLHSGGFSTILKGNWINNGIFNAASGTVILNGSNKTLTGGTIFNNFTVNGTYSVAGSDMNYNGLVTISTGAVYSSSGHATINGDLTNNGTLIGEGTTTFSGTKVQTIRLVNALQSFSTGIVNFNGSYSPVLNSNSSPQFATLNINNTGGMYPSIGGTVYIALNIGTGAKLGIDNAIYTVMGSFTNNGTVSGTGTLDFEPATPKTLAFGNSGFSNEGKVIFGGSGQITLTGEPEKLNSVYITNTHSAGISPSSDWIVDSNFVITENSHFNAGAFTYSINGDVIIDGVFNGGTSTFITTNIDGADLSASAETVFHNFINNGNLTSQTDLYVEGNFTNNKIYDGSLGTLIMSGENDATIGGTAAPNNISQLTIQKSENAVITQNGNLSGVSFLNISSGTLFTSMSTISPDLTGSVLIINEDATFKLGGTLTLPAFNGYGLDVKSNVNYAGVGTTQSIANAAQYGNLIISGTGSKNALTALTVLGNLSITAGTFNTSTVTLNHSISGNFTMTGGGTISGTNATYTLNGTEDQQLKLLSNLPKLTVNKLSGKVILGSNVTVDNILTFKKGNIQTGNFKVILPSTGSVAGASQTSGWVNGNLQKNVSTGTNVSKIFEIGDSAYYTPSTVLFNSVTTVGNVVAKVTPTDHPEGDYSGIDTTKSVNRFWSITNAGVGFTTAAITFNWVASDIDAGSSYLNFKTAAFNRSTWLLNSIASPLSTSIKATGVTGFGDFQVGEALAQFKWTGNALTADWNTKGNWSGGIPTTALNTRIPAGLAGGKVYPVLNAGTGTVKDLFIENDASLIVENAQLQVSGTITNSGILEAGNGTIEWNGSNAQTISANLFNNNAVNHIIISNSNASGVSLNGDLDIYGSLTYTGSGRIFNTNDNLTLKSTALNTASVGDMTGNTITGKVTVERYLSAHKAWRLLSVPTNTNQTINQSWQENSTGVNDNPKAHYGTQVTSDRKTALTEGFDLYSSGGPSMKTYNSLTDKWVGVTSTNAWNIKTAAGYLVFIRGDRLANAFNSIPTETTLRTKGELNVGTQPVLTLVPDKFTVVGNPYASSIDFSKISKGNGVDDVFYVWDPFISGSYNLGGYQTMSSVDGYIPHPGGSAAYPLETPASIIQSGQAFFMHSTTVPAFAPLNYEVIFSESVKSGGSGTVNLTGQIARGGSGAGTSNKRQFLRVTLFTGPNSTDKVADGNVVAFDNVFSDNIDGNDALKITAGGENFDIKRNGKMLVIEARNDLTVNDTIYYNMTNMAQKTYQLRFAPVNMQSAGMQAFLTDKFLNHETPVSLFDSTFIDVAITSNALSKAADRFSVIFRTMAVLPVTISSLKATLKEADILVEWKVENELNISNYEVEKSTDGVHFSKRAIIAKTNNSDQSYKWMDKNASAGYHYYRIKTVDETGQTSLTQIVKVLVGTGVSEISVYPNPIVNEVINVQLTNQPKGQYQIKLINPLGQVMITKDLMHTGGSAYEPLKWNRNFAKGIYQLEITKPGGEVKVIKVVN